METPVLLAHEVEESTDIFGISGGGDWTPQTTPPVRHCVHSTSPWFHQEAV